MKYLLKIFIFLSLLNCASDLSAQVKGVKYALLYNSETQLFDCYLFIHEGEASSAKERVQFNAQFSIVVPTGANVSVVQSYMPLLENLDFKGTQAIDWAITSKLSTPYNLSDIDIYGITPRLAPTGFYNMLVAGDLIKLFSIRVASDALDIDKVRIFDNVNDPKSYVEEGMLKGDFSNGFTIGGFHQIFEGIKILNLEEAN